MCSFSKLCFSAFLLAQRHVQRRGSWSLHHWADKVIMSSKDFKSSVFIGNVVICFSAVLPLGVCEVWMNLGGHRHQLWWTVLSCVSVWRTGRAGRELCSVFPVRQEVGRVRQRRSMSYCSEPLLPKSKINNSTEPNSSLWYSTLFWLNYSSVLMLQRAWRTNSLR